MGKKRASRVNPNPATGHNEFNNNFQPTRLASTTSSCMITIERRAHHKTKNSEEKNSHRLKVLRTHNLNQKYHRNTINYQYGKKCGLKSGLGRKSIINFPLKSSLRNSKFFRNMKPASVFTIYQPRRNLKSSCNFY